LAGFYPRGDRRADAVVFVVSPDAVASEECGKELEHAASEHKRLIPVVCRDVEGLGVAEVLQELNWVFLREGDDFDAGVVAIERGLELNLEYIRVQTRVLTRARAWELAGRRPSPLLRGEDLRSAERWLERAAAGGEPQPTELQAQFVGESRRFAARRQRTAVVASLSVAVAVVAVALAAFAFIQRAQARHEARVAQSRQLGAQAESELASDPEDSIALAVKGVTLQSTPGAIHALFRALDGSRLRIDLRQPGPVDAVAFSPDSTTLATGSALGAVRMWRLADRRVLWSQGRGETSAVAIAFARRGDVLVVLRSPHRTYLTSNGPCCSVEVLNARSGAVERTLIFHPSISTATADLVFPLFVGFIGASRTVAIGYEDGTVSLWNVDHGVVTGRVQGLLTPAASPEGHAYGMGLTADGREIAAGRWRSARAVTKSRLEPSTASRSTTSRSPRYLVMPTLSQRPC
jgi:hypothetical protein